MIPAIGVAFAIIFAITPLAVADQGGFAMGVGEKHQKQGHGILIDGFTGSIPIPVEITAETQDLLKSQISVTLGNAVSVAETNGFTDAQRAGIGIVQNEQDSKYLAWIITSTTKDTEAQTVTTNSFVVDAGDATNFADSTQTFDHLTMDKGMRGDKTAMFEQFKQKFLESTGDPVVDAARAKFLDLKQQLMDAIKNGDTDTANSIKKQLEELKPTIPNIRYQGA